MPPKAACLCLLRIPIIIGLVLFLFPTASIHSPLSPLFQNLFDGNETLTSPGLAIGQLIGDEQPALAAHFHALEAHFPAADQLPPALH